MTVQTINYNTDQFTDPVTGATLHDDGSAYYLCPSNKVLYFKLRIYNGMYTTSGGCGFVSYMIVLTSTAGGYVAEDGSTPYVTEDQTSPYVLET